MYRSVYSHLVLYTYIVLLYMNTACYSPNQYSCAVNQDNWFASQLIQAPVQLGPVSYQSGVVPTGNYSVFELFFIPTPANTISYVIVHFQTNSQFDGVPQNQFIQQCTFNGTTNVYSLQVIVTPGTVLTYSFTYGVGNNGLQYDTPVQFFTNGCPPVLPTPAPTRAATQPPTVAASCVSEPQPQCGSTDRACNVLDPYRTEAPWANSSCPYYQCYSPDTHVCTNPPSSPASFLCPVSAPLACGRSCYSPYSYSCQINTQDWLQSTLLQGAVTIQAGQSTVTYSNGVQPAQAANTYNIICNTQNTQTVVQYVTVVYQVIAIGATSYSAPVSTNCTYSGSNQFTLPVQVAAGGQVTYKFILGTDTQSVPTLTQQFTAGSVYNPRTLAAQTGTTVAPSSTTQAPKQASPASATHIAAASVAAVVTAAVMLL